jgi:hypothetical protein
LQQWNELGASGGRAGSTVQLGHLVQALSRAETADEVARVIAEAGSVAAGAEFANIAVANLSAGRPGTANLYHASSLAEEVAQRYMVIPLDDSTPLGTVLRSGGEVWLRSLSDIGTRYPSLLEDTVAAGLVSTRPCSMLWISSWAAGRTYGPRPLPSPLSTPHKGRSGIASPDIRPCYCATPAGPSPCSTR